MANEHYFSADPASASRPRRIEVVLAGRPLQLATDSGVFSPERLDTGTRVLLEAVPTPSSHGNLLDVGTGWGPLAIDMALRAPAATVWAIDVNARVLELAAANAVAAGAANVRVGDPESVPPDVRFQTIWSNPPIRVGKAALHRLLLEWLPRLEHGGEAWLVVAKQLGADSLQQWLADTLGTGFAVSRASTAKGYRVLHVERGSETA
ncbi:class I SAM-dependent methyltransferase [Curtobacterium ammoniigenes]|uniref:class I SAM-dependent methyltransferase n=1 Tax=Curtobacterium ammoniigenes TaxID=395387 RepID=UPI00082A2F8D|nr:methyltransferase [Curtobacterium ammoniigenes]